VTEVHSLKVVQGACTKVGITTHAENNAIEGESAAHSYTFQSSWSGKFWPLLKQYNCLLQPFGHQSALCNKDQTLPTDP